VNVSASTFALALAPALAAAAFAQTTPAVPSPSKPMLGLLARTNSSFALLAFQPAPTNQFSFRTYRPRLALRFSTNREPSLLKPGVYETTPYTCIVVAPPASPDDRCIVSPGVSPKMPARKPDLQFIPRNAGVK
jgi:hypothetical protein